MITQRIEVRWIYRTQSLQTRHCSALETHYSRALITYIVEARWNSSTQTLRTRHCSALELQHSSPSNSRMQHPGPAVPTLFKLNNTARWNCSPRALGERHCSTLEQQHSNPAKASLQHAETAVPTTYKRVDIAARCHGSTDTLGRCMYSTLEALGRLRTARY